MGSFKKHFLGLIFPAFLLICQLANPISAAAAQIDPNELILQRLKNGESSPRITTIRLDNKERTKIVDKTASKKPMAISRPIVDSKQDYIPKTSAKIEKKTTILKSQPQTEQQKTIPKTTPIARPIIERAMPKKIAEQEMPEKLVAKTTENLDEIAPASGARALTWFSSLSNGQRMTITFNNRPNFSYDEKVGEVTFKFAAAANYEIPTIPENFKNSFQSVEVLPSGNLVIRVKHRSDAKHVISSNTRRVFLDIITAEKSELPAPASGAKTEEQPQAEQNLEATPLADVAKSLEAEKKELIKEVTSEASEAKNEVQLAAETIAQPAPEVEAVEIEPKKYINYDKNIVSEKDGGLESFTFRFEETTDAALFERFGEYWLLFYTQEPFGLPNISKSEIFSEVNIIPNDKAVIYKFSMTNSAYASAIRDGNSWKIEFNPLLETPVRFPLSLKKDGEEWFVNVPGIDASVDVEDDFTGEILTVFPSQNAGEGFKDRVVYRDFIIEKSNLGIVLRKISEGSKVSFDRNQLRFTPSAQPRKLFAETKGGDEPVIGKESYLIDFDKINALEKSMEGDSGRDLFAQLDESLRGQALFSQKFYHEASVNLGAKVGFDNSFLAAASYFLSGRYDKAAADFERINIPPAKDMNEFLLWEIAAKQELLKKDPRAKVKIEIPEEFGLPANLKNYPVDIATALQLPLIEAAINANKIDFAELVRNNISKKSNTRDLDYAEYLRAKILAKQGSNEEAIEVFSKLAAKTESREVRAIATYDKVITALAIEKMTKENALSELDKVRIVWRGDYVEFNILIKLAELYADNRNYPEALLAYKTALSAIPFHPMSDKITANMRSIYKTAMQRDFDNPERAFDSLALYYDYIELKPTGREGEYLTIELAERLVAFDLIQQGIDVLEEFVVNVKDVEEKALISTRIAVLYYYIHQPEKSLAQLETSETSDIPRYIEWQRKILFVRVLSEQGKYDEALTKINRIPPQRARELRAEIYWFKQDWQSFIDNFNEMTNKSEPNIMKAAIAYSMLGNDKALAQFYKQNSALMEGSKYAHAFNFITKENKIDYKDLSESLKLDFAKEVVDDFQKNLKLTDFFDKEVAEVKN